MSEPFDTIAAVLRRHAGGLVAAVDSADHLQLDRPAEARASPRSSPR